MTDFTVKNTKRCIEKETHRINAMVLMNSFSKKRKKTQTNNSSIILYEKDTIRCAFFYRTTS